MARRGAKPRTGRSISLRKIDRGTPELREKRRQLVGRDDDPRACSVLGILEARFGFPARWTAAARNYAVLFYRAVQPPQLVSALCGSYTTSYPDIEFDSDEVRTDYLATRET